MKKQNIPLLLVILFFCVTVVSCGQSNLDKNINIENNNTDIEKNMNLKKEEMKGGNFVTKNSRKLSGNKILLHIGEKKYIIDMYDNPTANDLISQLPLTLKINDYAGWDEKIVRLKKSLSMKGAPAGDNPEIPEFGYYEPGKWLAIYYGHIGYWSGKVPLGKINASVDELRKISDNTLIVIEMVK